MTHMGLSPNLAGKDPVPGAQQNTEMQPICWLRICRCILSGPNFSHLYTALWLPPKTFWILVSFHPLHDLHIKFGPRGHGAGFESQAV